MGLMFFIIAAWNIMTGRFIEVALKLAQPDMEDLAFEQRMRDFHDSTELAKLFHEVDIDQSETISVEEFQCLMRHPKLKSYLNVRGIDVKNAELFFNMLRSIAGDSDEVDIKTVVNACLRLKGFATGIDLQTMMFETKLLERRQARFFK